MKARPIIFSGPMVRALLDGTKSQTRRICKEQDLLTFLGDNSDEVGLRWAAPTNDAGKREHEQWCAYCGDYPEEGVIPLGVAYGQPGDLIYVREAHHLNYGLLRTVDNRPFNPPVYRATADDSQTQWVSRWRPSIHMPRWASRLTLQLTDVRVERVQEVSIDDAIDEGADWPMVEPDEGGLHEWRRRIRDNGFRQLWDSINAARGYGWDANPWVWALSFRVIHANVDDVLAEPERYLDAINRQGETA